MKLKEFLHYELISTTNIQISVYEIFVSALFVLVTIVLLRLVKAFLLKIEKQKKLDKGSSASIYKIIQYFVWTIILVVLLQTMGVNITVLIASSAALFVGLGFGLQNVFKDFISGLILLFERNLKVGDIVELNDGTVGEVLNINLRISEIRDRSNVIILVPNSKLVEENVINWSHIEKKTRFNIAVGVAYGSNLELVKELLLQSVNDFKDVEKDPEPFVRFNNFGDSSLEFELYFWTNRSFRVENLKSDIRFEIDSLFNKHKVVIAFPQMDVHLYKNE